MNVERMIGRYEVLSQLVNNRELDSEVLTQLWAGNQLAEIADEAEKLGVLLPNMEPAEYPHCKAVK